MLRPRVRARARRQSRAHLGGVRGQGGHLHVRGPQGLLERIRADAGKPGDRSRRPRLSLHGQDPEPLLRVSRRSQDGRSRSAALQRLRRRVAGGQAGERRHEGHSDDAQARQEGTQDTRPLAGPHARHRGRGRREQAQGQGGLLRRRESAARRGVRLLPVRPRDSVGAALHVRHDRPAQGRAARARLHLGSGPYCLVGSGPEGGRRLLVHRRPGLGHGHELRHHRSVVSRRHAVCPRFGIHFGPLVPIHTGQPHNGLVLGAHGHPLAHAGRRRTRCRIRPLVAQAPCVGW